MLSGNKGEWSEIYVFLKLLADGRLYAADEDLNQIPSLFYPLLAVLRREATGRRNYVRNGDIRIVNADTNSTVGRVAIADLLKAAKKLLTRIKSSSSATFADRDTELFLRSMDVRTLKAPAADKSDITLLVHDHHTNSTPELGFSIKSTLGGASTLLNPGKTTNFVYEIIGTVSAADELRINAIATSSKVRDRITEIEKLGCTLSYSETESANFGVNLQMIDTLMPQITASMILAFFQGKGRTVAELVKNLDKINPLNLNIAKHPLYEHKVKGLLTDVALGMTPATPWSGRIDATGGYIIVKQNGDILCYHLYNRNEFQNYLLDHTRFDTASTTRYDYAKIYSVASQKFFKLNLQIRFI